MTWYIRGPAQKRFEAKVNKSGPAPEDKPELGQCWTWMGKLNSGGYARFYDDEGKNILVHRWSYSRYIGEVPRQLVIDHLCRIRHCVNPHHLEAVSSAENIRRGIGIPAKNLVKSHCKYGHELAGRNLYMTPSSNSRHCRLCIGRRYKAYKLRLKEKTNV